MCTRELRRLALALAVLLALVVPAWGAVAGHDRRHRRDRAGRERRRPLPGATVTLRNTATNYEQVVTTDARPLPRPAAAARPLPGHASRSRASPTWCARASTWRSASDQPDARRSGLGRRSRRSWSPPRRRSSRPPAPRAPTASTRRSIEEPAEQRPQLPRLHQADPGRDHRPGSRRRRALDQRPEGHPQQRLGGRRRLQQPLLRRAARRPAAGLHLQPRRGAGGRGGRRRRQRRVRPLPRRLRQRHHEVGHQRRPRQRARLLQGRRPVLARQAPGRQHAPTSSTSSSTQAGFTLGGPLRADRLFYFLAADSQDGDSTKQTDPARIEPRVVDYFARSAAPDENGPIERTNDALVVLAKLDWQASRPATCATLRYTYT